MVALTELHQVMGENDTAELLELITSSGACGSLYLELQFQLPLELHPPTCPQTIDNRSRRIGSDKDRVADGVEGRPKRQSIRDIEYQN